MGRNRRMFRLWLLFAGTLMPRGGLPRRDTELVILRVSHLTGAEYEAVHHRRMGRAAGLTAEQIDASRRRRRAGPFSARQALLLRAVDELARRRCDRRGDLRRAARASSPTATVVELCMLAGHYRMLAGLINSLRIVPDVHR